jgi:hypothetical protein
MREFEDCTLPASLLQMIPITTPLWRRRRSQTQTVLTVSGDTEVVSVHPQRLCEYDFSAACGGHSNEQRAALWLPWNSSFSQ